MCIRDSLITLADFYGVSVDDLLCRTENREQINTPLTELHLNDEMVALLKSGRINNRLLCELATHKDFIKFLADIEIYVDEMCIRDSTNASMLCAVSVPAPSQLPFSARCLHRR